MDWKIEKAIGADWQRMIEAEKLSTKVLKEVIASGLEKWKGDWDGFSTWALCLSQRLTEAIRNNNEELIIAYWALVPRIMERANEIKPCIDYRAFIDSFFAELDNEEAQAGP